MITILKKKKYYKTFYKCNKIVGQYFILYYNNKITKTLNYGITITKNIGNSVIRNKCKRIIKNLIIDFFNLKIKKVIKINILLKNNIIEKNIYNVWFDFINCFNKILF